MLYTIHMAKKQPTLTKLVHLRISAEHAAMLAKAQEFYQQRGGASSDVTQATLIRTAIERLYADFGRNGGQSAE
jgi:hypothetical protein